MRTRLHSVACVLALAALGLVATRASAAPQNTGGPWLGADERPLPFADDGEILDYLRNAEIVSIESIPVGTTKPRKVLLERGGVRAHAIFRDVDMIIERVWLNDGSFHMRLRDAAVFEVAAYRMSLLLGFENVPPAVMRRVDDTAGSLQLWVENAVTEDGRRERGGELPDRSAWFDQFQAMFLFDFVIGNVDRNTGNYLTDAGGKLWMIDHTRAFQMHLDGWSPDRFGVVRRSLWERLSTLERTTVDAALGDVLDPYERDQLWDRVESLVGHLREQIAARGEASVLIDR